MKKLTRPIVFLVGALMLLSMVPEAGAIGQPQLYQERLEVGRALIEVQASNLPSILPYYSDDIEYHDPIVDIYGIETMTAFLFQLFGSSPDLVTTIEDETLVDGIYSVTWTMVGQFAGVPYDAKGISIIKFRGRTTKVFYQRDYYTEGDIMVNIPGLDEAILGFRTYYRCAVDPTFDCPLVDPPGGAVFEPEMMNPMPDPIGRNNRLRSHVQLRRARLEVGRALVEINADNWQSLLPYYAENYEYHDPIVDIYGFETLVPFFARLFASSPDLITTIEDETIQDGVYMATWTMTGQFDGIPYTAPGMSIVKFVDGGLQTDYSRDYYTEGDIMISIPGLDQAVLGFRTFYRCAVDPTFECPLVEPDALIGGRDVEMQSKSDALPSASTFSLNQNVPNPFNPTTEISFVVPDGGANMSLRIYDVTGRLVKTLVDGFEPAGAKAVNWFGKNDQGRPVASGVYYYLMTGPDFAEKKKMVLLK